MSLPKMNKEVYEHVTNLCKAWHKSNDELTGRKTFWRDLRYCSTRYHHRLPIWMMWTQWDLVYCLPKENVYSIASVSRFCFLALLKASSLHNSKILTDYWLSKNLNARKIFILWRNFALWYQGAKILKNTSGFKK